MLSLTTPQRLDDAVSSISRTTPIGSVLSSEEIARIAPALRRTAFFSAKVESARLLTEMRRVIQAGLELTKVDGVTVSRELFIELLQDLANDLDLRPKDNTRNTLQDIGSRRRLQLIFETQTAMAAGEARYRSGLRRASVSAIPAYELRREQARREPRDWPKRWAVARQALGNSTRALDGRMIAPKGDPIWTQISRFGNPWPPFDFNSGMGLRGVRRREAEELDLAPDPNAPGPELPPPGQTQVASTKGIDADLLFELETSFVGTAEVADGQITWTP